MLKSNNAKSRYSLVLCSILASTAFSGSLLASAAPSEPGELAGLLKCSNSIQEKSDELQMIPLVPAENEKAYLFSDDKIYSVRLGKSNVCMEWNCEEPTWKFPVRVSGEKGHDQLYVLSTSDMRKANSPGPDGVVWPISLGQAEYYGKTIFQANDDMSPSSRALVKSFVLGKIKIVTPQKSSDCADAEKRLRGCLGSDPDLRAASEEALRSCAGAPNKVIVGGAASTRHAYDGAALE